ncbi:hypothetical protein [Paraflavitalea sp. CAU 1676]|uniref:hypothetical protein n=1 Tax=Paraflavitalea sp. CAU 1676 TaxID=3032598 RepID=UPI0023DA9D1E|nr:hypothetical protein [Paraflavitalea sp. CAU 1676]MDF2187998.1 hypothetical protein [Paraflavitalea sp. CAU 1676]
MAILKYIIRSIVFLLLTILTQIGGVVYLLSLLTHRLTDKQTTKTWQKHLYRTASFVALYNIATFLLVPLLARPFGRVPLPLTQKDHLRPLTLLTCLLNRHYVVPAMKKVAIETAREMNQRYPGTETNYLDANFPFLKGFPLIPHLSHNDGKKLDLAFYYLEAATDRVTNEAPSPIGYGVCEEPLPDEVCTYCACSSKGNWQYSFLTHIIPQGKKDKLLFDASRTKTLAELFAQREEVEKIFIEPHLKTRLHLQSGKIRFHGCQAVRHDDHLHIQLK